VTLYYKISRLTSPADIFFKGVTKGEKIQSWRRWRNGDGGAAFYFIDREPSMV
jgi:hypothetical protein